METVYPGHRFARPGLGAVNRFAVEELQLRPCPHSRDAQDLTGAEVCMRFFAAILVLTLLAAVARSDEQPAADPAAAEAQPLDGREGRPLALENFRPEPRLRVDAHL